MSACVAGMIGLEVVGHLHLGIGGQPVELAQPHLLRFLLQHPVHVVEGGRLVLGAGGDGDVLLEHDEALGRAHPADRRARLLEADGGGHVEDADQHLALHQELLHVAGEVRLLEGLQLGDLLEGGVDVLVVARPDLGREGHEHLPGGVDDVVDPDLALVLRDGPEVLPRLRRRLDLVRPVGEADGADEREDAACRP